jgi:5-methylcytosine-specific restriction endonuclease McrA|tara:strand:- start:2338 stop:2676 length:339 start_codon:yes stop_codon:yes gene_type:complete
MSGRSGRPRRQIKPELKDVVRERDGSTCRMCLEHSSKLQKQLQVHHIRPMEMGGNDRRKNLISLCDICHRVVHKNVERYIVPMRKYVDLLNKTGEHYTIEQIEKGEYSEIYK